MTRYSILLLMLFTLPPLTYANITSTTGNATPIPRPADDRKGSLISNTQTYIWPESQNDTLTSPLAVDLTTPGTFQHDDLTTTTLPAGSSFNSYYVSFQTTGPDRLYATGSITFDQPILAIIARNSPDPNLDNSNYLGLGTLFSTGETFLGLEASDTISLSPDRLTFSYNLSDTSPGDHFRILTQIPEPSLSLLLLLPLLKRYRPKTWLPSTY